jgi:hypothetical protein
MVPDTTTESLTKEIREEASPFRVSKRKPREKKNLLLNMNKH